MKLFLQLTRGYYLATRAAGNNKLVSFCNGIILARRCLQDKRAAQLNMQATSGPQGESNSSESQATSA